MRDTVIGNDVWIGQEATIMPGIHIGSGAIIGTKAVVATDIPLLVKGDISELLTFAKDQGLP